MEILAITSHTTFRKRDFLPEEWGEPLHTHKTVLTSHYPELGCVSNPEPLTGSGFPWRQYILNFSVHTDLPGIL